MSFLSKIFGQDECCRNYGPTVTQSAETTISLKVFPYKGPSRSHEIVLLRNGKSLFFLHQTNYGQDKWNEFLSILVGRLTKKFEWLYDVDIERRIMEDDNIYMRMDIKTVFWNTWFEEIARIAKEDGFEDEAIAIEYNIQNGGDYNFIETPPRIYYELIKGRIASDHRKKEREKKFEKENRIWEKFDKFKAEVIKRSNTKSPEGE